MLFALLSALWLGILTSISPCPLATNITAVSYIGKYISNPYKTLCSGILYSFGRVLGYVGVSLIILAGLSSVPSIANFLQHYINLFMGPILIMVGVILLELITINFSFGISCSKIQNRLNNLGLVGAFFLGTLFALSFCPLSAALFFGSLIPLSLEHNSNVFLPVAYGIGTGLPVIFFAFIISFGINSVGRAYDKLVKIECSMRKITGVLFIISGVYYIATYIFGFTI